MAEAIEYTTDEELGEIVNKDQNVEIIGFVESLTAPLQVGTKKWWLFKVVVSNGNKKVMLLIWGKDLIDLYQPQLTVNKIVHLEKATSKLANLNYRRDEALIDYELTIGKSTKVNFLGTHGEVAQVPVTPKTVDFPGTVGLTGPIVITGWLKTEFTLSTNQNNTSSWGSGAITDKIYKINVQIAQFVSSDIEKGVKIELQGEIKTTDLPTTVHCLDMTKIRILEEEPKLSDYELRKGCRTPRRPLEDKTNDSESLLKKRNLEKMDLNKPESEDSDEL